MLSLLHCWTQPLIKSAKFIMSCLVSSCWLLGGLHLEYWSKGESSCYIQQIVNLGLTSLRLVGLPVNQVSELESLRGGGGGGNKMSEWDIVKPKRPHCILPKSLDDKWWKHNSNSPVICYTVTANFDGMYGSLAIDLQTNFKFQFHVSWFC